MLVPTEGGCFAALDYINGTKFRDQFGTMEPTERQLMAVDTMYDTIEVCYSRNLKSFTCIKEFMVSPRVRTRSRDI